MLWKMIVLVGAITLMGAVGCHSVSAVLTDAGTDSDSDSDSDSDTDADADTDSDTDTGSEECCNEDCPCDDPLQCVLTPGSWENDMLGVCKAPIMTDNDPPDCWMVDDCWEHQVCAGVIIKECDSMLTITDEPGECVSVTKGCCDSSSGNSCSEGYFCMPFPDFGMPYSEDVCHHVLNDNLQCWTDDDCADGVGTCEGAQLCSCSCNCISVVGQCEYSLFD